MCPVKEHCNFVTLYFDMDKGDSDARQPNILQEETDVLVREVQAHSNWIYGNADRPPRTDEAEVVWEEVMVMA